MGILKRALLDEEWRERAECRAGYDPELWTLPDPGERDNATEFAKEICAEVCPVRESCLRRALRDEYPSTYGVIRGGIAFDQSHRVKCWRCGYAVARRTTGVCTVCEDYDPCLGECGRMVRKESDSWFCVECKVDEEGLIG